MAKLTAKEIQEKLPDAVEVGEGMENGLIVLKVHQGHIEETYSESVTRRRASRCKAGAETKK